MARARAFYEYDGEQITIDKALKITGVERATFFRKIKTMTVAEIKTQRDAKQSNILRRKAEEIETSTGTGMVRYGNTSHPSCTFRQPNPR